MRWIKAATFATSLLLGGCATTPTVIGDYCGSYNIIRPSRKDTPDTLRQVARENFKWRAVCDVKKGSRP